MTNRVPDSLVCPEQVRYEVPDNLTLVADVYGRPGSPPVLLLHGGGQTRRSWDGTARTLAARGYRAVALDLRGHGDSDWSPDGTYDLDTLVRDVSYVVQTFSNTPVLVGASLGGIISLLLNEDAQVSPTRAVVLVDVAPRTEDSGVERITTFMRETSSGFASLNEAAAAVAEYLPGRPRPKSFEGLKKNLRVDSDGRYRWHWDPRLLTGLDLSEVRDEKRLLHAAQALRIPLLFIRGTQSDVVTDDIVREFQQAVPQLQFSNVAGAGHMVAGDANDAFSSAILAFFSDLPG